VCVLEGDMLIGLISPRINLSKDEEMSSIVQLSSGVTGERRKLGVLTLLCRGRKLEFWRGGGM